MEAVSAQGSMSQILDCPSCGAPLQYREEPGHQVTCSFCGNSVLVPQQTTETTAPPPVRERWQRQTYLKMVLAMVVALAAFTLIFVGLFAVWLSSCGLR